jgi:hypothetical protein
MKLRKDSMQEIVASKASVSVSTARRIENERHQLKKAKRKGVLQEVRTDSLSAAYKNNGTLEDFTARYEELIAHYGFIAKRNNRGVAHGNGAIESSNRHVKYQVEQALRVRGPFDFNCCADYEASVGSVSARHNKRIANKFKEEQRRLQTLPACKSVNYSQEHVRVRCTSDININRAYSASALMQQLQEAKQSKKPASVFELIAHRYERHRLIITSNQSFEDWDTLFTDVTMTVAAIDRLVHHAHIVRL